MCAGGDIRRGRTAEQTSWNIWSCATNISPSVCESKVYVPLRSVHSRHPPDVLHPRQGAKPACRSALLLAKLTEVLLRYF